MDREPMIYITLSWIAVISYVVGAVLNIFGLVFRKERTERMSYWPAGLGLLVHTTAILYWWQVVGHGPYMAPSEVLMSDAWITACIFLIFSRSYPRIRPASMIVFPAVFLMVALAIMFNPGIRTLPPTFGTIWLVLHISFYKIALGTLVIALAFSLFYLMKERSGALWLQRLPDLAGIDLYAYRFTGFGFIFWAIAMLSGSIWAYKSWGRYWGWDPVETWALITWLLFGTYLHLRRFFRWSGRRAAWFFIACFITSLFSLFVSSHLGISIHAEYFR